MRTSTDQLHKLERADRPVGQPRFKELHWIYPAFLKFIDGTFTLVNWNLVLAIHNILVLFDCLDDLLHCEAVVPLNFSCLNVVLVDSVNYRSELFLFESAQGDVVIGLGLQTPDLLSYSFPIR